LLLDALAPALEKDRRVVAFDRRGHGYTADTDQPFHYDDMATETIGVLEHVGGRAHLVGWSDGVVALLVAMRRPDLVERLVVIGANYSHEGVMPLELDPSSPVAEMMMQAYVERSPDGAEHFSEMARKFMVMVTTEPTLTLDDIRTVGAPTLVMVGDDDLIKLSHTCELFEALPAGQLAVVPRASHALPLERPDETARLILEFLDGDPTQPTFMPIRRSSTP
jgi:pimeloyl-ACP methyl ester carboxylesterase